jgi:hypothetical protein
VLDGSSQEKTAILEYKKSSKFEVIVFIIVCLW